jgi:hypothetical protein
LPPGPFCRIPHPDLSGKYWNSHALPDWKRH